MIFVAPTTTAAANPDEAMDLADFAQGLKPLVAAVEEIIPRKPVSLLGSSWW